MFERGQLARWSDDTRLQNSFKHLLQGHDRNRICSRGLDMDVRRRRLRGSGRPFFGPNINRN